MIRKLLACGVRAHDIAAIAEVALVRGIIPDTYFMFDISGKSRDEITQAQNYYGVKVPPYTL